LGPARGTYAVMTQATPQPPAPVPSGPPLEAAQEGYAVAPPAERAELPQPATKEQTKFEEQLAAPRLPPPPPRRPLVTGVYTFPFYKTSLTALCILSLGFFGEAVLFRALLACWPEFWK